jgi:hypothetical protein
MVGVFGPLVTVRGHKKNGQVAFARIFAFDAPEDYVPLEDREMNDVDLTALLYLNPELTSRSNLATAAAAAAAWATDQGGGGANALPQLARTLPTLPAGFDSKLYLAAQPDVSRANEEIRLAMIGVGMSSNSVERRGVYVATLVEDVGLLIAQPDSSLASLAFGRATGLGDFSPSNLRVGDSVRLQRASGARGTVEGFLQGRVTSIGAPTAGVFSISPEASPATAEARRIVGASGAGGSNYELVGIRIWDPERQAMVALARGVQGQSGISDDSTPASGFSLEAYRDANAHARTLSPQDAYLDWRGRCRRRGAPSPEYLPVSGRVGVGMPCVGTEGDSLSSTRLAVDGDIFTTGTLLSLSDARAKTGVEVIDDPIGRVSRLVGCTYAVAAGREEAGVGRRHTGLLAQDVAAAMPEAVYSAPAAALAGHVAPESIAYGNLAGLFVEAIKELSARLSALEARM